MNSRRWQANLELCFAQRDRRSIMTRNIHRGPLQVQKTLYPEGPGICHVVVLHPPGGIVSGDSLTVDVRLEAKSAVCATTPGATKWYRCPEDWARQRLRFSVADEAVLEWLPRENILFDASRAHLQLDVDLAATATFFGWEILCFGRRASGEAWRSGGLRVGSQIRREGRLIWSERANVAADGGFAASTVGLMGFSVSGTFVVAGAAAGAEAGGVSGAGAVAGAEARAVAHAEAELLTACRSVIPVEVGCRFGITRLPGVLLIRYLGHSSEAAFRWFTALWTLLRPALSGAAATPSRLWAC